MNGISVTAAGAAQYLLSHDNFRIITHAFPDGDTLGSGAALCAILRQIGKKANVICPDAVPEKYSFLCLEKQRFKPRCTVAVDIADMKLTGTFAEKYGGSVGLCIDHHPSNVRYAELNFINPEAAATGECIFEIAEILNIKTDKFIADALYTAISTDTGCFRFGNTTAETHRIAARLLEFGADAAEINRKMFETKSRARIEIERLALENIEYRCSGKCAVLPVTLKMQKESGCSEGDLDGITSIPRTVEGVLVGITLREKSCGGKFKISVRTHPPIDASAICARFGGGGHLRAAGCELAGDINDIKEKICLVAERYIEDTVK